jgi:hypothetical protein
LESERRIHQNEVIISVIIAKIDGDKLGRKLFILNFALSLTFFAMVIALLLSVPVPTIALILVISVAFVLAVVSALLRRKVRQ